MAFSNYTITIMKDNRDSHSICDRDEFLLMMEKTKKIFVSIQNDNFNYHFIEWLCKEIIETLLFGYIRKHGHESYDKNCEECQKCYRLNDYDNYDENETNVEYYDCDEKHEKIIKNFNELFQVLSLIA
jgi:hypothetical protein